MCIPEALFSTGPSCSKHLSLTSPLRDQLVKSFWTLKQNTLIFFVEKMRGAFTMQKLLTFFQQKILAYNYEILTFEILTKC